MAKLVRVTFKGSWKKKTLMSPWSHVWAFGYRQVQIAKNSLTLLLFSVFFDLIAGWLALVSIQSNYIFEFIPAYPSVYVI